MRKNFMLHFMKDSSFKLDQVIKAFEVLVYLERKISDFEYEFEDEFVLSGGI